MAVQAGDLLVVLMGVLMAMARVSMAVRMIMVVVVVMVVMVVAVATTVDNNGPRRGVAARVRGNKREPIAEPGHFFRDRRRNRAIVAMTNGHRASRD